MKTATVTEAKNGLSALLKRVRGGETVLITDRGVPIARIEPVSALDDPSGHLERLSRAGVVRSGTGVLPAAILDGPNVSPSKGGSVLDALLEERRTGR